MQDSVLMAHHWYGYEVLPKSVEKVISEYWAPEIFNTDQGSDLTNGNCTGFLTNLKDQDQLKGLRLTRLIAIWSGHCGDYLSTKLVYLHVFEQSQSTHWHQKITVRIEAERPYLPHGAVRRDEAYARKLQLIKMAAWHEALTHFNKAAHWSKKQTTSYGILIFFSIAK